MGAYSLINKYLLLPIPRDQGYSMLGGSPGQVVVGGDSRSKGRGFESRCWILDGHDIFHIDLL